MKLARRDRCPLCGHRDFVRHLSASFAIDHLNSRHFKVTDNRYGQSWNFDRCLHCGFVFSNPCIHQDDITRFYAGLSDTQYSAESRGRGKNFQTILSRLKSLSPPGNRLLDIGAASGIFLQIARQKGYRVAGIEPSREFVEEARRERGIELFPGTLEEFDSRRKFSAITLIDLIEHVVNPRSLFERTVRLLEKGGILVIVTPDIDSLAARFLKKRWWHYRVAHLNFFNLSSLTWILEKNGLKILRRKRYAWNFSLFYLFSRLLPLKNRPRSPLQKMLKNIHLKLQLFDSWEIYAEKR